MKKILISAVITMCAYTLNGQTKEETKDFIKKYTEACPQNNGQGGERNDIAFTTSGNDFLVIYSIYLPNLYQGVYTFAPKDIQSITIDKVTLPGANILHIKLKYGTKVYFTIMDSEIKEYKDNFDIMVGSACVKDNIPERLKKALESLANLCGGTISVDKY